MITYSSVLLLTRKRLERVDRIPLPGQRFGFIVESVAFKQCLPIARAPFAFALAAGPALEVADRRISVNADHFFRILRRPVVGIQAAAADADQRAFFGQAFSRDRGIKRVECFSASGQPKVFPTTICR